MPSFLPPTTLRRRAFLTITILFTLVAIGLPLYFATRVQAVSTNVVISEFRVRGPQGGNDEFVELYNLSAAPVAIGGWNIRGSNNAAGVSIRATITAGTIIQLAVTTFSQTPQLAVTAAPFRGIKPIQSASQMMAASR